MTNGLIALVFSNFLLFGGSLEMGEEFTAGLLTGMGAAWLLYAVGVSALLKRRSVVLDERSAAIISKASGIAFWVLVLAASLLAALLRSERLGISVEPPQLAAILADLGLVAYGISALVVSRGL